MPRQRLRVPRLADWCSRISVIYSFSYREVLCGVMQIISLVQQRLYRSRCGRGQKGQCTRLSLVLCQPAPVCWALLSSHLIASNSWLGLLSFKIWVMLKPFLGNLTTLSPNLTVVLDFSFNSLFLGYFNLFAFLFSLFLVFQFTIAFFFFVTGYCPPLPSDFLLLLLFNL